MNQKIELSTNLVIGLFNGTYQSMWEIDEQGYRTEYDFKEFMRGIVDAYQSQSDNILSDLNISWIKEIKFTGDYYSPREYNFETDSLDFIITIDKVAMLESLKSLENDKEFSNYLYDNYTTRSGFISFTPNNYKDLKEAIESENDEYHQAMGALIHWLGREALAPDDYYNGIEGMVQEYWSGNGYGGINYTIHCDIHNQEVLYDEKQGDIVCSGCQSEQSTISI